MNKKQLLYDTIRKMIALGLNMQHVNAQKNIIIPKNAAVRFNSATNRLITTRQRLDEL